MSAREAWQELGGVDPSTLTGARLQLHWASQVLADVGETLAAPQADTSQSTLVWVPELALLAGKPILSGQRFGLDPAALALTLLDSHGALADTFELAGKTLADGYAWTRAKLTELSSDVPPFVRSKYDLDANPLGDGTPFARADPAHFEELGRWFADTDAVLSDVVADESRASLVRCWPHHFDLATLITFDQDESDAEKARSANLGMSPGDAGTPEPYLYVGPWPYPAVVNLPALEGGGTWSTEGWVGAALRASRLVTGVEAQRQQVHTFFASALAGSKKLLEIDDD